MFGPWENSEQKILGEERATIIMPLCRALVEMIFKGHQSHYQSPFMDDDDKNNNSS